MTKERNRTIVSNSATAPLPRLGFIGLGLMGHGMAKNLVANGYGLTILGHVVRTSVDDLVARGAREAEDAAEVAAHSDIVFLCVTGSPEVEALVRGPRGLKEGAHEGLLIVDCSTSDPNSTMNLAAELRPLGIVFCDAPLGGTPAHAEAGTLSALVGCDEEVWPRLRTVIAHWATCATRIGAAGDGHKMKLLMNFLSLGYAALYAELLAVAVKVGITPRVVDGAMRGSRMDCGVYQTYFRWVLDRDREAHKFTLRNAHKDMRYLVGMANAAGVINPLGATVKNAFAAAEASGHGDDFVPMLSDIIATLNGVALGESSSCSALAPCHSSEAT